MPLKNEGGFSILEVLICISLVSVLSITLATIVQTGVRSYRTITLEAQQQNQFLESEHLLRRLFSNTFFSGTRDGAWDFVADRNNISFSIVTPEEEISRISIQQNGEWEGATFTMTDQTYPVHGLVEASMFPGETTISWIFFGVGKSGTFEWQRNWTHRHLPRLVRFIIVAQGGQEHFIDIFVQSQSPRLCVYQIQTDGCIAL